MPSECSGGADRLAARRFVGQAADVHLAPLGEKKGARDRRCRHNQDIGPLAFGPERESLGHAESVLLVDHCQGQIMVFHGVLEQRVGADDDLDGSVFYAAQQAGALAAFDGAGQQCHRQRA